GGGGGLWPRWGLWHHGARGGRRSRVCPSPPRGLGGPDPADPASSRAPVHDYVAPLGRDVGGVKIGVPRNYFFDGVDPEVGRAFEDAIGTLRELGAEVRDVQIPSMAGAPSFLLILMAEAYAYHERDLCEHPELYGEVL